MTRWMLRSIAIASLAFACASPPEVGPVAAGVLLSKEPPAAGLTQLGFVAGVHGFGCGFAGLRGNEAGAMADLRNKAAAMGANYVQIREFVAPYSDGSCLHNEYRIEGTAYR